MAISAFKSTSKRGNLANTTNSLPSSSSSSTTSKGIAHTSDNVEKRNQSRRSRRVSATSRATNFDDFVNKRDNPLYNSSPPNVNQTKTLIGGPSLPSNSVANTGVKDTQRGRAVSRGSGSGNQLGHSRKMMGQSLSRIDTGRRHRSVSRVRRNDSESESENKYKLSSMLRGNTIGKLSQSLKNNVSVVSSDSEQSSNWRNSQTCSDPHPLCEPSDQFYSYSQADCREDATSTSSFSEAEEKTILAFTEQIKSYESDLPTEDVGTGDIYETVRSEVKRAISEIQGDLEYAIQKKNLTHIAKTSVADIPPELVNPDAIELVSEIRSEYGAKLRESQERARRLRADLAVEEHREQEFDRILEEVLPEPKNPQAQKSRTRRKQNSMERRKMSKRLTEEAMNYFDECVSISTFDGSDFSSAEDPMCNFASPDAPVGDHRFLLSSSSSTSANYHLNGLVNNYKGSDVKSRSLFSPDYSESLASVDSQGSFENQDNITDSVSSQNRKFHFSLSSQPTESGVVRHEMGNIIKMFEKDAKRNENDPRVAGSSYYDKDYCELATPDEKLLFDKVILRNRIESGVFLLCDTWT